MSTNIAMAADDLTNFDLPEFAQGWFLLPGKQVSAQDIAALCEKLTGKTPSDKELADYSLD